MGLKMTSFLLNGGGGSRERKRDDFFVPFFFHVYLLLIKVLEGGPLFQLYIVLLCSETAFSRNPYAKGRDHLTPRKVTLLIHVII